MSSQTKYSPVATSSATSFSKTTVQQSLSQPDFIFKIVLCGDSGCGKSSLLLRYAEDSFSDSFLSTIGVDFKFKSLYVNEKLTKLQIWDTAGNFLFPKKKKLSFILIFSLFF